MSRQPSISRAGKYVYEFRAMIKALLIHFTHNHQGDMEGISVPPPGNIVLQRPVLAQFSRCEICKVFLGLPDYVINNIHRTVVMQVEVGLEWSCTNPGGTVRL